MGIWISFEEGTKLFAFSQVYVEKNRLMGTPVGQTPGFGLVIKKCLDPDEAKALLASISNHLRECRTPHVFFQVR